MPPGTSPCLPTGPARRQSRQTSEEEGICCFASTSVHGRRVARVGLPVRLPRVLLHQRRSFDYLWRENRLPRPLKLRLYAASVCSTLTHASEAWMIAPRALATINDFNSRQLHCITGCSYCEVATNPSYDLLTAVRTRRHQCLGHTLRMPADRLVRRAVLAMGQ